jgi:catechol 2,3-dioxygenase-like lactoylglutathione lyase family enzyme
MGSTIPSNSWQHSRPGDHLDTPVPPVLHHVSLEIPPQESGRSAEFWAALGFVQVEAPPEIAAYVSWFERGGTQIHLIRTPTPTVPAVGHTAVVASDFDRTVERLQREGFEVQAARRLWGAPRAVATAPGGHRVELMAAPPG